MGFMVNGKPFQGNTRDKRIVTVDAAGGTATLEALHGADPYDPGAIWKNVPDGDFAADTAFMMEQVEHQWYQWTTTGAATVWVR
jgi:hypothetical protein